MEIDFAEKTAKITMENESTVTTAEVVTKAVADAGSFTVSKFELVEDDA